MSNQKQTIASPTVPCQFDPGTFVCRHVSQQHTNHRSDETYQRRLTSNEFLQMLQERLPQSLSELLGCIEPALRSMLDDTVSELKIIHTRRVKRPSAPGRSRSQLDFPLCDFNPPKISNSRIDASANDTTNCLTMSTLPLKTRGLRGIGLSDKGGGSEGPPLAVDKAFYFHHTHPEFKECYPLDPKAQDQKGKTPGHCDFISPPPPIRKNRRIAITTANSHHFTRHQVLHLRGYSQDAYCGINSEGSKEKRPSRWKESSPTPFLKPPLPVLRRSRSNISMSTQLTQPSSISTQQGPNQTTATQTIAITDVAVTPGKTLIDDTDVPNECGFASCPPQVPYVLGKRRRLQDLELSNYRCKTPRFG